MTEYINKEKLIKAIEDNRPLNWNDTEAELAEQRAYDDIIGSIEGFNEEESDRINELMEADKEGRCLILPCKVGDTVYYIEKNKKIYESKVHAFSFSKDNLKKYGQIHIYDYDNDNATRKISNFGKTIFLTKEEAEKALEGLE